MSRVRRWRYGLEPHEVWALLEYQQHKCALRSCGSSVDLRSHVDHSHSTGNVRGMLCRIHNIGLGHFSDSPQLLRDAATYLEASG